MRFGKIILCFATVGLIFLTLLGWKKESEPDDFLSVEIAYSDRVETVTAWETRDNYYLFLPGNRNIEQMKLRVSPDEKVFLDGEMVKDGVAANSYQRNRPYSLTSTGKEEGTLTILQSSQLPALFLDVSSGNMEHIHAVKGNEEPGTMRLYEAAGQNAYVGAVESLKGRGNSTWKEPKKSYSLNLAEDADLLGMGAARKWILLSGSLDMSNLRNKIVYDFAQAFGLEFSPDSRLIDLYLNGEYAGVYLLCERNEVHRQRVNIPAEGSFLVSRDLELRMEEKGVPHITTDNQVALRIYHSDWTAEQLKARWQSVENAITAEDGIDPETGTHWQELIDLDSWARKYLIEEVFGNTDGFTLSQFFYLDGSEENGKIHAGPVWDYDLAMYANSRHEVTNFSRFVANLPDKEGYAWAGALYQQEEFLERVAELYASEFYPLLETYLQTVIPALIQNTADASGMNALRWGYGNAEESTNQILEYLSFRKEFLLDVWQGDAEYYFLDTTDANGERRYYAVREGSIPAGLPVFTDADSGFEYRWRDAQTGALYDVTAPVFANAKIRMHCEQIAPEPTQPEPEATPAVPEEEKIPQLPEQDETEITEPIALSRLLPVLAFLGMLMLVLAAGLVQSFQNRKKRN